MVRWTVVPATRQGRCCSVATKVSQARQAGVLRGRNVRGRTLATPSLEAVSPSSRPR
jgi:hypothetical protein